mmetsp:Transcript_7452/g.11020  ORF Transcript_7452/g.11020 Transcript_7452/m.11020 type:complete len:569 (-) Transcript_7452:386-2092(-)
MDMETDPNTQHASVTGKSALDRFVGSLCSSYDIDDALPQGIRHGNGYGYGNGNARGSPTMQLLHEPQCSCTLPSLSLIVNTSQSQSRRRRLYKYDDLSYTCASTPDQHQYQNWIDDEHVNLQRLLSREARYANPSLAAQAFLRNLVASFGTILEFELIRRLQNVCEKLDRLTKSESMQRKKDKIMQSFLKHCSCSSSNKEGNLKNKQSMYSPSPSPAIPISARVNFNTPTSTSVPIKEYELNHSNSEDKDEQTSESTPAASASASASAQMDVIEHTEVTSLIMFKAEIQLFLPSSHKHVDVNIRTTGKVHGRYQNGTCSENMNIKNSIHVGGIHVSLDMDILYASIKNECRHVTKQIINAMAGTDLFERKWKSKARPQRQPQPQGQGQGQQSGRQRYQQRNANVNGTTDQVQTVQHDNRTSYENNKGSQYQHQHQHQHRGVNGKKQEQHHSHQALSTEDDSKTQPTLDGDESTTASFESSPLQVQNTVTLSTMSTRLQHDHHQHTSNVRAAPLPGGNARKHQTAAYASSAHHAYTKREKRQEKRFHQNQKQKTVTIISPVASSSSSSS